MEKYNLKKMLKTEVLLLGADCVGKTTLLYLLKMNQIVKTIPTIGFNVEDLEYKNRKILMWDIGGGEKIRTLWKHYMQNTNCIVFMLNISDKERFNYHIETFNILLDQIKDHNNIPIIIFGNKFNDKIDFEPEEMLQKSKLPPEISPFIIKGNITKKEGIDELLDYIYDNIEFTLEEPKMEEKEEEKKEEKKNKESFYVRMFGLDDSGKTTILYLLKLDEKVATLPTIGFNVEVIDKDSWPKSLSIWDVGGQEKIRTLWIHYFSNTNGIIWVYDISNNQRIEESQKELKKILDNPQIDKNIPLLIFANKSDLNDNGNKPENFLNGLEDYLNMRPYFVKECNANDLESYKEGIDWLYSILQ